jgi:hypothetical protein
MATEHRMAGLKELLKPENLLKDKTIFEQRQSIIKQEDKLAKIEKAVEQLTSASKKH